MNSDLNTKTLVRVRLTHLAGLAVLAFATQPMRAAVTEAWVQRYNGPANRDEYVQAVVVDGSGNVVVTGSSHGATNAAYYTAKYAAANGALLWEKRYTGPVNGYNLALAVAVDAGGNVVVTGESGNGSNNNVDFYTAKYAAANGDLLWEKRYATLGDSGGNAVAVDTSGNVVVTGPSDNRTNGGFNVDYYTAKYAAADGALLWAQRYNGPANGHDYASAVAVDASGNVVVTGGSENGANDDSYTAKYAAADGALLWEQRSANGRVPAVAVDSSGNVVVTGGSTTKYAAADGMLLWANGSGGASVAVDGSGNVVVTGSSHNGTNYDFYTAKYAAADGALLWEKRYNGPANGYDTAEAVAVDDSGDVVVMGTSHNGTNYDFYTAKYAAADGTLLWEKRYNGPANGNDNGDGPGLALGPNGMVAITGWSEGIFGSVTNLDYATVVYRETLLPVSIAKVPIGIRLRFPGVADHSYQVLRAPSLSGLWSTNATLTAITNGVLEYLDTNAPPGSAYYRTAAVP